MNNTSPTKTLVKGAGIVFGGNILLQLLNFIYHIPIVRLLGPERYGIIGIVLTIITAVYPLGLLGLGVGVVYYLSRVYSPYRPIEIKGIIVSSVRIVLFASLVFMASLLVFSHFYVGKLYPFPQLPLLLSILCVAIPILAFCDLFEAFFRAVRQPLIAYKAKIYENFFRLLLIPPLLFVTRRNLIFMALGLLLIYAIPVGYSIINIFKHIISWEKFRTLPFKSYTSYLFAFSWPLLISQYVQETGKKVDIFFIGYFMTAKDVGIYRPVVILASVLWFIPQALTYLLFPIMNQLLAEGRKQEFYEIAQRTLKYVLYTNLPLITFLIIFSSYIIKFLYGPEFTAGVLPFTLLAVGRMGQCLFVSFPHILRSKKKTIILMIIALAGMSLNLILNYFLVPRWGLEGAAFGTLSAFWLMGSLSFIYVVRLTKRMIFSLPTIGTTVISTCAILVYPLLRQLSDTASMRIALYGVYLITVTLFILLFDPKETEKAWSLLKRKINKIK